MKYRKKPIVIEAFRMTEAAGEALTEWPTWLIQAWWGEKGRPGSLWPAPQDERKNDRLLRIGTLEGDMQVMWGDYIIQGIKGELYPCQADIFHMTYEEVSDE